MASEAQPKPTDKAFLGITSLGYNTFQIRDGENVPVHLSFREDGSLEGVILGGEDGRWFNATPISCKHCGR